MSSSEEGEGATPGNPEAATPALPAGAVVVGVDGSAQADEALRWAAEQALLERRPLVVLHAAGCETDFAAAWIDAAGVDHQALAREVTAAGQGLVLGAAALARDVAPGVETHTAVRLTDPRQALLEVAREAALVILGSRGLGPVRSLVLGSVSSAVARHGPCPVVVVRPACDEAVHMARTGVVAGTDSTPASRPVLEHAFRHASVRGLPLTVLHCDPDPVAVAHGVHGVGPAHDLRRERLALTEAVDHLAETWPDVPVRRQLSGDDAAHALAEATRCAHLVVVGGHRPRGHRSIGAGARAATVLEHARGPVAVVPLRP